MILLEILIPVLIFVILAWLMVEYSLFVPPVKGLPILMYHKVSEHQTDALTIGTESLNLHFTYLKEKGYNTIFFSEFRKILLEGKTLPSKTVILTFDDAYQNFRELVLPMLKRFGFKACVFVPVAYMGKTNSWDKGNDRIMSPEELNQISDSGLVEIGLHSFLHRSYGDLALSDMEEDLKNCFSTLSFYHIPYSRVLAYPYGGYPKKDPSLKSQMSELFKTMNLDFALRIGNRINHLPIQKPYEMKRIDIKGTDPFFIFRIKLKKGRAKLFA